MAVQNVTRADTESNRLKMTYEEFLEWANEDTHAEWVDGEVIIHMPANEYHQSTLTFLLQILNLFVNLFDLGKVLVAPFAMRAESDGPHREPDILFIGRENLHRLSESQLSGPADLVVELISDDSVRRDRYDKFHEYRLAGIREYWIIDPRPGRKRADFYYLNEQSQYELFATEDEEQVASRVLPGFWLRPSWLWEVEDRDPLLTFFEIRGLSHEQAQQIQQTLQTGSTEEKKD
jgi:Uma2 family endonuclease